MQPIDEAWQRVVADGDDIHTTRLTASGHVVLRSLDWAWSSEEGVPEQTWTTGLGTGDHMVAVTTADIGAPTRLSKDGTTDILFVGDLMGESPEWRRVEGDLPFRRGVAIVPDLASDDGNDGGVPSETPWSEALRTLETLADPDGTERHFAIEAFGHPLHDDEHHGRRVVAATATAGLGHVGTTGDAQAVEVITHGWAARWEGVRDGRLVAVSVEIGDGLRRTLESLRAVADPWVVPVGSALACDSDALGPEPEYSDPEARMPYSDAFIPEKHPSERAVTVSLGEVRFPSGVATVVNPTMPDLATDLVLALPTDRRMPCFVAPTVQRYGDLLMRTGDTVPVLWRLAILRGERAPDGYYGRGLVAICDRGFAERLRADRGFAERVSELAFSLNPMVLHDPESGEAVGVAIATEGDEMVRPLLGLDGAGAVAAIAVEVADAADISLLG